MKRRDDLLRLPLRRPRRPRLKRTLTITLDFDWFYRAFFPGLWRRALKPVVDLLVNLRDLFFDECIKVGRAVTQADALAAQIPIFREWSLGSAMVLTTFVLFVYLIVGFLH
jgi:multicomponent Na+:H+ antiporter subunit D